MGGIEYILAVTVVIIIIIVRFRDFPEQRVQGKEVKPYSKRRKLSCMCMGKHTLTSLVQSFGLGCDVCVASGILTTFSICHFLFF